MKVRMLIGTRTLTIGINLIAYDKAAKAIDCFIGRMNAVIKLKKKAFKFANAIKQIQAKWRRNMKRDKIRINVIRKKWIEVAEAMMKQKGKGKKHQVLLRKIRGIAVDTRECALKNYYLKQQRLYYEKLAIWEKRGAEAFAPLKSCEFKKSVENMDKKEQLVKKIKSKEKKHENIKEAKKIATKYTKYPNFNYIPDPETLSKIVIQAANNIT